MKSIDFLISHFSDYKPENPDIYMVFFSILSKKEISNINELILEIDIIEQKITKNDIKLLLSFQVNKVREINLLNGIYHYILKFFFMDFDDEKYFCIKNLYAMKNHSEKNNKQKEFNIFKYYFPYSLAVDTAMYSSYRPYIYYLLRSQLILYKTKDEMMDRLKYDHQLKSFIAQTFYDVDKEIINKNKFLEQVHSTCQSVFNYLNLNEDDAKKYYYQDYKNYKDIDLTKHFGDVF